MMEKTNSIPPMPHPQPLQPAASRPPETAEMEQATARLNFMTAIGRAAKFILELVWDYHRRNP